ncbi:MAG: hypothetical protein Q8P17_00940 [bacterium]|nr:hypothetical protein [bacterium]
MSEFLKMDIFFFVTTLVVIVVGILIAYVLWRVQRVLKNVEHISEQVAMESDLVRQDLADLRNDVRAGKGRLRSLFGLFGTFAKRSSKKS